MGTLVYNGNGSIPIDDRLLAHLQVVIIDKLRRQESFPFTWQLGGRETTVWFGPSIALEFVYSGGRAPSLNRAWLHQLAEAAASNAGLSAIPEPLTPSAPVPTPDLPVPAMARSLATTARTRTPA